jgi:hypothetical protein
MTDSPNLGAIVTNPVARKVIYGTYGIVSLATSALQVYDSATKIPDPSWLAGALAVIVFLGVPVGGLAIANAPKKADQ